MSVSLSPNGDTKTIIPYLDLGGGLNTSDDDHSIGRDELSSSINCWYSYGKSIGKRPGSTAYCTTTGATGSGSAVKGMVTARFNGYTYVVVQQGTALYAAKTNDTSWVNIGSVSSGANSIQGAQMFDPLTTSNVLFIVNGVDPVLAWKGPGNTVVNASTLTGASLPQNYANTATITPSYVTTYQNFLVFAGEPSFASGGVFVSNPSYPTVFTTPASTSTIGSPTYQPYMVGNNDGVNGGNITGICSVEQGIVIFKESAIYAFTLTSFYGDTVFYPSLLSASIGCTSPYSIAKFDGFAVFLGLDGVYTVSISTGAIQLISGSVSTYFDSSLTGYAALIQNRTTAVGVRHGARYIIFFTGTATYPSINANGLWFDFRKLNRRQEPTVGEIQGMQVAAACSLRGPNDDGNFVWGDSGIDRVGKFGLGFSDPQPGSTSGFGANIQSTFIGKSDFLHELFPRDGALRPKQAIKVWLVLSLGGHISTQTFSGTIQFSCSFTGGLNLSPPGNTSASVSYNTGNSSSWGSNWGTMTWGTPPSILEPYALLEMDQLAGSQANNLQLAFTENSTNEWLVIGYYVEIAAQAVLAITAQST